MADTEGIHMKAADIPDNLILSYLAKHRGKWTLLYGLEFHPLDTDQREVITPDAHPKVLHAKMRQLLKRKLVSGCPCGCRGDWEITEKGLAAIGEP